MTKKIFLAAPFYQHMVNNQKSLRQEVINELKSLIELLESLGYEVHNAHQREDWGNNWMKPQVCTPIDYHAINEADIFIAFPGQPASGGVHIEIGWASAFNKKIFLLLEQDKIYSNLIDGLPTLDCYVEIIRYKDFAQLLKILVNKL